MPYLINKLTITMSPLKLFDYMSTGKPIVSTSIHQAVKYKDLIYIADTSEEFSEKINIALKENESEKIKERLKIAYENGWDDRFNQIKRLIKKELSLSCNY